MKKKALCLMLLMSLSLSMLCPAAEPAAREDAPETYPAIGVWQQTDSADAPAAISAQEDAPETHPAIGAWQQTGTEGPRITLPGTSYNYNIYPDGTVCDSTNSLCLPATFLEDGSFTIDTSGTEELAKYTITGQVWPASPAGGENAAEPAGQPAEQTAEQPAGQPAEQPAGQPADQTASKPADQTAGQTTGQTAGQPAEQTAGQSENNSANQMVLTITYPDPQDPLTDTPAVTRVYFTRKSSQTGIVYHTLTGKVWKVKGKLLKIDAEGQLDLNDAESTGKLSVYSKEDPSLALPTEVEFRWKNGGIVKYTSVLVTSNTIHLQNINKPEETLVLEYVKEMEMPELPEAKPFVGVWEVESVWKGDATIDASALLECDSMTAEVTVDGNVTLAFSSGYSCKLKPDYENNALHVNYNQLGHHMDWTAKPGEDGTATATFEDYRIQLIRK